MIFLRAALGPAAVAQPAIDLGSAWGAFGDALGFGSLNPPFTPYEVRRGGLLGELAQMLRLAASPSNIIWQALFESLTWLQNDITFLLGAFLFEDVGVTAYKVPLLRLCRHRHDTSLHYLLETLPCRTAGASRFMKPATLAQSPDAVPGMVL